MINRLANGQTIAVAAAITLLAVVLVIQFPNRSFCPVDASSNSPSDYCISIDIDVTNNTGAPLTNYPIRYQITSQSLINNLALDSKGWGMYPTLDGSFASEMDLLAQDMGNNDAAWWTVFDSIPDGVQQTQRLYMGNGQLKRDQGIQFTGREFVSIPDAAQIDGGEIMIEVEMINVDETPRTETIMTKTSDFGLQFINNAGTLALAMDVRGNLDICVTNWNSAWTNQRIVVNATHVASIGAFTEINVDGSIVAICDGGSAGVSTNNQPWIIGDNHAGTEPLTGVLISDVRIRCCSLVTSDPGKRIIPSQQAAHLTFDATRMSENISSVNPFVSTVQDQGLNNFPNVTYTVDADQSNISVVVNSPSLTSLTVGAVVDPALLDQTGQVLPDTIFTPPAKITGTFYYTWFVQPMEGLFTIDWLGPTIFIYAVGIALALGFGAMTNFQFAAVNLTIMGFPAGIYAANGWTPWPFVIVWIVLILSQWLGLTRLLKDAF